MQMSVLPPEILITIINTLTSDTQLDAYTYTSEVKEALRSLALVNHAYHGWSSSLLYYRITITKDQIGQLVATLSEATPRIQSLAKRVHSLRLVIDPTGSKVVPRNTAGDDKYLIKATSLLRILASTLTLQRLFMETDLNSTHPGTDTNLRYAASCLTSLAELVLINRENRDVNFFWDIELAKHQYDCLLGLQVLIMADVTINDPGTTDFLLPLVNLKMLVLIRPWIDHSYTEVGSIIADLFAPHRALRHLTFVLIDGWEGWGLDSLTAEDLGPKMAPHLDKVDIFSERNPQAPRPWTEIGNMIGMGHQWGQHN
ncbi:hypothetical protein FRB94_009210 [Tulasnella sp. JGI-2019a]|nr:hypothetical protein FRB93_008339 [Tulasnella sp. JGI-2019a]KAG8995348.1 hypothetical protein FRB94_009210 [Tulasnella sp. JGI-2019a]